MSIKYWWSDDFQWFCVLVDDGNSQSTISLTREQAADLSMEADPSFADLLAEGQKRALKLLEEAHDRPLVTSPEQAPK
jgi:hypothetical protein